MLHLGSPDQGRRKKKVRVGAFTIAQARLFNHDTLGQIVVLS